MLAAARIGGWDVPHNRDELSDVVYSGLAKPSANTIMPRSPLFKPDTPEDYKPIARKNLLQRLEWVDGELAGKDYLMGEHFSVADAYLFTVTGWPQHVGLDISGLKHLAAWRERIAARPAVQAAMKAEGLLK